MLCIILLIRLWTLSLKVGQKVLLFCPDFAEVMSDMLNFPRK